MTAPAAATATTQVAPVRRLPPAAALLAVAIAVLVSLVLSLVVGTNMISPARVIDGLLGSDRAARDIVVGNRLPRALLAILVGASLGVAGHLMQSITRNPLADPGLLGIEAGAAAAVVSAIAFFHITTPSGYVWFALPGAVIATVAVYVLGSGRAGGASPVRLILAGAAISACLYSYVYGVIVIDPFAFSRFRYWVVGSLTTRDLGIVGDVGWVLAIGLLLALLLAGPLNAVALGDEVAVALGARTQRTRILGILAIALLCGAATAAVGPVGFIGLAVPHVSRALIGVDHRWALPMSVLTGVLMVQLADIIGRLIAWPQEVGVGVVTAVIGAPVLVWLVRRGRVVRL